ncbi:class I SAM-dependent methyltransferase [Stappia taiwanensis]|uniref:Class I SAM-dependent methyltransferase n=1 Tax=Stappia taiwanensis TaxID=992267 RepID=A0A838XVN3_9HYPH|nr:cyclopropane-fatty-acyl-phospholipid synthase family protein [Stappia taiwanensis]MBA4611023.1 class I SAM-dependent methyltransferase [Stappia taiwanensis]GGE94004.1 cyclopropane-fatty-acyl-phospholipid synthase [Stappia taiwanensis]
MSSAMLLTPDNARQALAGLPRLGKLSLRVAMGLRHGSLDITTPEGRRYLVRGAEPGPAADVTIHSWRFARRLISGADVGVGEAYMAGEWTSTDVTTFLELFCINRDATADLLRGTRVYRMMIRLRHWLNRNTRSGSRRNISSHYDLGNDFYREWLDPSMTYSSALFEGGINDLEQAQRRKYHSLVAETDIRPNHHVLEIGCGWGGFAEYVAREVGARVTALTISREQYDFACQRMQDNGLAEKVEIKLQDYRDETRQYDRIASIEMFEAVGESYWQTYFRQLSTCLKAGGRAGLQIITIQDRFFEDYRKTPDFIQRHVFPGGMLPPPGALAALGNHTGLELAAQKIFGHDYARTLEVWRQRFRDAWPRIRPLGFDERFKRLWEFYFHYCEAGFRSGNIDVRQMIYVKAP